MNRNFTEAIKLPESFRLPFIGGWLYRKIIKWDNKAIQCERLHGNMLNSTKRDERIIASLTSYPARIEYVSLAIKSILLQTYRPDRVILYLANSQFPTHNLPDCLTQLKNNGLEIVWMEDYYGHKKYHFPIINQRPDEVVITFDDDIIYPPRCIERLMQTHRRYPHCLVCERGQVFDNKKKENPGRWKTISSIGVNTPTFSMNPSPGGGCLIPYGAFYKDATDVSKFIPLAFKNDDLWYMFMCAEQGTRMIKTHKYHRTFSVIDGSQGEQMASENVSGNRNILILKGLIQQYPTAWKRIYTDED